MGPFYIDFVGGNDALDGLSKATAWQHLPGTRTTAGTSRLRSTWGSAASTPGGVINRTTNQLAIGTTFLLKCGTTYSAATSGAGYIWLGDSFYVLGATAVDAFVIKPDPTWGTGPVIFDGAGWTESQIPNGIMFSKVDGVTLDGLAAGGIVFQNSPRQGFYATESAGTTPVKFQTIRYVDGLGNGTYYATLATDAARDTAAAANGTINMRRCDGMLIEFCTFNGDGQFINGVVCGDQDRAVTNGIIRDCVAYGHHGVDDAGIGFKAFNSQVEIRRCVSHDNFKGADLGENTGADRDITYKVIDSEFYSNSYGLNFNGAGVAYAGAVNFYAINCQVRDNTVQGMNVYAGPFNFHLIHCVLYNNGTSGSNNYNGHLRATPDHATNDTGEINIRVLNSIFHTATKYALETKMFVVAVNDVSWESDYNCFIEVDPLAGFCRWGYENGADGKDFAYGANGPGHLLGEWQTMYGKTAVAPANGQTGHFGCDVHSKGTGATNTSVPSFTALGTDFTLTAAFPGTDLSAKPWYIAEMGTDRLSALRVTWDMGPYEFRAAAPAEPATGERAWGNVPCGCLRFCRNSV